MHFIQQDCLTPFAMTSKKCYLITERVQLAPFLLKEEIAKELVRKGCISIFDISKIGWNKGNNSLFSKFQKDVGEIGGDSQFSLKWRAKRGCFLWKWSVKSLTFLHAVPIF